MPKRTGKQKGQLALFKPVKTLFGLAFEPIKPVKARKLIVFTEGEMLEKHLDKSKFIELKFFNPPVQLPGYAHMGTSIYIPKKTSWQRRQRIIEAVRLVNQCLEKKRLEFSSGILHFVPPWQINFAAEPSEPELMKAVHEINALLKATWPKLPKPKT